jgi:hypothetical protein
MLNAVRDKFGRIQHLDFHVSEENQVDSIFINTICMYNKDENPLFVKKK